MEKQVTRLDAMRKQALGEVVTIPGWVEGETINVRLRKVDLTAHILAAGPLPNALAAGVGQAFGAEEGPQKGASQEDIQRFLPVFDAIAREALVEPRHDEILAQVAPLTFEQKLAIFDYATANLQSLGPFRVKAGGHGADGRGGKNVGDKTK